MLLVDQLILVTGILVLLGIVSSKFSFRFGVPVLVLFLVLGMLAGSEGIGGIAFENYSLAHAIGSIALAFILFDGGLSTPVASIRMAWKPSLILATLGVLVTAVLTGLAAHWILGIPMLYGMLLGSIVGSTDAAAVFSVLRSGGVELHKRLAATLEIESASNDPMAIFLTIGLIEVLQNRVELGIGMATMFVSQMVVGTICGLGFGFLGVWVVNRIRLDAAGMYPILVSSICLLTYGITVLCGGSGFLAVYLAGIILGNRRIVFGRGIMLFHDATAWLSQIVMFVVLGLLSFPSRLLEITGQGLLVAAALILIARPAAVLVSVLPFRFNVRELTLLSWVGLKGAVPITLATFPLFYGVDHANKIFDVVFFVVLVSASLQGSSLPFVARWLKLSVPPTSRPPVTLELSSLQHVEGDIVDYQVNGDSRAAGRLVKELALPDGVVIAIIARGRQIIPPQGHTRIEAGDHVILVMRPGTTPLVNKVFASRSGQEHQVSPEIEFPLRASIRVGDLQDFYGLTLCGEPDQTLAAMLENRLGKEELKPGAYLDCGQVGFYVRQLDNHGQVAAVGMVIH